MTAELRPPFPIAVGFDWDNTLIDNWEAITEALNKVRAMNGLETWTVPEARVKSARALRVSFPEWFGDKWEAIRDIFYTHINAVHIERLRVMPGAAELLAWLQEQGIPMFVVSTKKNKLLQAECSHLGWNSYFSRLIGSLDLPKDKPHRLPVDEALSSINLKADNPAVWYVGDTHADVELALNSGITPVFVGNLQQGERLGVKLNFSDCTNLKTELNKWNN